MIGALLTVLCLSSPVKFFENAPLYQNPIANPRSPESGLVLRQSTFLGERVEYLEGEIGKTIAIFDYHRTWQVGIEVGTWMMLGYNDGAFPLLTQDFYFSFPLYFKFDDLTGALKFNHISSHKGDGIDKMLEQTLSEEEKAKLNKIEHYNNLDIELVNPVSYSRDFLSLDVAYEGPIFGLDGKTALRAGYAHKMIPSRLKRWFFGYSLEARYGFGYYAQDITYNQDVNSIDFSLQIGIMSVNDRFYPIECRLALTGYRGSDRRGQFLGRKLEQVGIGLFFR